MNMKARTFFLIFINSVIFTTNISYADNEPPTHGSNIERMRRVISSPSIEPWKAVAMVGDLITYTKGNQILMVLELLRTSALAELDSAEQAVKEKDAAGAKEHFDKMIRFHRDFIKINEILLNMLVEAKKEEMEELKALLRKYEQGA